MLKPFRVLHFPFLIIGVILCLLFVLNLNFLKPQSKTHDHPVLRDFSNGAASFLFANSSDRSSLFFRNRAIKNPGYIRDIFKTRNVEGIFPGLKYVHIDLKGAPPKVSFLSKIFPLLKRFGATGVLLEYEDMFPYSSANIAAKNCYSKADIQKLLNAAKENNLDVIPLLQTFGHAEFILKLKEFKHLREVPSNPQAFCPSSNDTVYLLKSLIDNVIELHPSAKYLHIGCDEVFLLAKCARCLQTMAHHRWNKKQLFFNHVAMLARYIKEKYPTVTPLVWDDELRSLSPKELKDSQLGSLVEPVVWRYTSDVQTAFQSDFWAKYASVFPKVWIATAFKGAISPDAYTLDIDPYVANHLSWMETVRTYSKDVHVGGVILTGWQRYDHFSVLCELLPVGFLSLAVNLAYLSSQSSMEAVGEEVKSLLKCDLNPLFLRKGNHRFTNHCSFPGSSLFESVSLLPSLVQELHDLKQSSPFRGWMNKFNVDNQFSSPSLVEQATSDLGRIENELISLEIKIEQAMDEVYDRHTVDEWLTTYMKPHREEVKSIRKWMNSLLFRDSWPRRPFALAQT